MPCHTDHMGLALTTTAAEAAARYSAGGQLLVRSSPDAVAVLGAAVAADRSLGVALAALALSAAGKRSPDRVGVDALELGLARSWAATRRERQHIEVVEIALRGDGERARALGHHHLSEFPDDVLIVHLVGRKGRLEPGEANDRE